ncbi:MAG: orotate phosphoribosyltransferase [Gammaproteobacteria bacterium]|jgi:orotate phosphoribosyltransferase|nr:orotate phosphoribosyltransferase [Gammaproteobacteria bacterium]MBT3723563.1 orotate phosphoribosyltransferase [Gammaproteobacteria bacterium]MBT6700281.1 orotate phosphoribosyltransferase [Gammaproteobacteria bacterium]MBT7047275.1 orotate phosphoribosyltransferase [Gammaproteobacteria bacterium]MBT7207495.1 orotate phosphoribosyltransferase [Gammaproteobacteria bacterium]
MLEFQHQFLDYCIQRGVLKFGEFTLKSGRISPYFFNAGLFNTGKDMDSLGKFYAQAITHAEIDFDVIFGPAYKGIPLAAITSSSLYQNFQIDKSYAYDRKEKKDHGEGGLIVGAEITGDVLIIDDVITAGTAIRQSMKLIDSLGAKVTSVTIALDRQEKGQGELSAIQELQQEGVNVIPIIKLADIMSYLEQSGDSKQLEAVQQYRELYGIA